MKECIDCRQKKSLAEFSPAPRYRDGHTSVCRACMNKRTAQYRNTPRGKKITRAARLALATKRRAMLNEHKAQRGCLHCGLNNPAALDFHHRDKATKTANVSSMTGKTEAAMLAEIEKCDVVCKNCHLIIHEKEKRKGFNVCG